MAELALLLVLALYGYYLWDSRGVDELATRTARQACQQRSLQFLDFSVQKQSTKVVLDTSKQPRWLREYVFEFYVEADAREPERYFGQLKLIGRRVSALSFDPYPIPEAPIHYTEGPARCMRG